MGSNLILKIEAFIYSFIYNKLDILIKENKNKIRRKLRESEYKIVWGDKYRKET